jgi:hypothetical protein
MKPPHVDVLSEASHRGFAKTKTPSCKLFGKGSLLKNGDLAEAMLVKSSKMVAKPLMPKSLAKAMLT